jgi:hypothetical protein|tara:strand:- start:73 stop:279 length:207 start_codon:yes stop_codon:yes gene_type:complete
MSDAERQQARDKRECAWINDKLDEMEATLEGCDWCCGGGDEMAGHLRQRLKELGGKRERGRFGWYGAA